MKQHHASTHVGFPSEGIPACSADVAIVGGGLAGTLASYLLGRAGYSVTLIDRHRTFPQQFRAEKLGLHHMEAFGRFGLLPAISARAVAFDTVETRRGRRLIDRVHSPQYGILYHDIVEAIRAELPPTVRFVVGEVNGLQTGEQRQQVAILGQQDVTARLLVMATGMSDILRRDINITRKVIRPRQSIAFGFDLQLSASRAGPNIQSITCYGNDVDDGIDYLSVFPVPGATRANIFAYCAPSHPWVKAFREAPAATLKSTFPYLAESLGDFDIDGAVDFWIADIVRAENCRQGGVVLIGDVFQTSSPAAGNGVSRLLTDVERLCSHHLPRWMLPGSIGATEIAAFYEDPVKKQADMHALQMADFRQRLTIGTGFTERLARHVHFTRRRAMHVLDLLSPALAGRLREIKAARSRATALTRRQPGRV